MYELAARYAATMAEGGSQLVPGGACMITRKSVGSLTEAEKKAFVNALLATGASW